jgi:flavin-dependent dehydrogenase
MGNAVLKAAGVWPKIESAGFVEKFGAEFMLADGAAGKEIVFADGWMPGLERTFQVERAKFDSILLEHARSLGAEVRIGSVVRSLTESRDFVTATLAGKDGAAATVTARWVLDAGGRENLCDGALKKAYDPPQFPRRAAVYSHFEGVKRAPGRKGGNIIIVRIADGWFWVIPIGVDRTSVGLVTAAEGLRGGGGPQSVFHATVEASPRLRALMERAVPVAPFRVTADYSYVRKEFASPRIVLVGDSAGFYDPIFSSGVYISTHSAQKALEAIAGPHEAKRPLSSLERRRYTRGLKAHCVVFRRLIEVFYDNDGFSVFMTEKPPLGLGRALTSIVAGHVRLTWPLWWRFKVFLAVCRIQKFSALVKRIEHSARVSLGAA